VHEAKTVVSKDLWKCNEVRKKSMSARSEQFKQANIETVTRLLRCCREEMGRMRRQRKGGEGRGRARQEGRGRKMRKEEEGR
jgi:hypothetical protein